MDMPSFPQGGDQQEEELPYTDAVAERTAEIYGRVKHAISDKEWPHFAPLVDAVIRLKKQKNALILAHNYQTRDIFHCVSDVVGDSLYLAKEAVTAEAEVIVQGGVHFMAETTKLLNPGKTVLIPDINAGCSLAASITGADVRRLKEQYPGVPVVSYVNTSAEVKAESDICCTSANARKIVESLGVDRVIMTPDKFLARNTANETDVEIIIWDGVCEVHENFTADQVVKLREAYPNIRVLAHPECPPEVIEAADFSGSTSGMAGWVDDHPEAHQVAMITECSMSSNLAVLHPEVEFIRSCGLCPHMQLITLEKIKRALETMTYKVEIDPAIAERARRPIERMLEVGR